MANLLNVANLSNVGGILGGGRVNLPGTPPAGAKTPAPPKTSSKTQPSSPKPRPATLTAAAPVSLRPPSKLASLLQPEITKTIDPGILTIRPEILTAFLEKTTTQLARSAITQLKGVNVNSRNEAITTVQNRGISPGRLMGHLERRVKIGEVLNNLAEQWEGETQQDFAEALNMDINKRSVMDTIVSLAILNDPDLEDELRIENMSDPSEDELLSNRRIIWQYPPPGTPLDPPYMVFVAVEHQELAEAQEVIDSILGQLTTHEGFKVPKTAGPRVRQPLTRAVPARQPIRRS